MNNAEVMGIRNGLLHINSDASLRYFEPLIGNGATGFVPRDRFGNRVFISSTGAYFDRAGNENKAGILISREGENFIKRHPGILSDIERGAFELTDTLQFGTQAQVTSKIDLGRGRKIQSLPAGDIQAQSSVFLLEIDSEKYVVKKKAPRPKNRLAIDRSQPYINEMLQTQRFGTDLHDLFANVGIIMATFMFATGQFSCSRFEEGRHPTQKELGEKIESIWSEMYKYLVSLQPVSRISKHYQPPDLWDHIKLDLSREYGEDEDGGYGGDGLVWRTDNFILRPDNKIVCIDPFYYDPPYSRCA
ncbi:MAG TPA: hypothetical protein VNW29_04245 [Candidatus Sulfotelmatobacter sp.]|jgi:hypothetical protein|nr:hypothetical protein [Candidatus Sulfotelmatobacter sp.]